MIFNKLACVTHWPTRKWKHMAATRDDDTDDGVTASVDFDPTPAWGGGDEAAAANDFDPTSVWVDGDEVTAANMQTPYRWLRPFDSRSSATPESARSPLIATCAAMSTRARAPSDPPAPLFVRARVSAHARTTRRVHGACEPPDDMTRKNLPEYSRPHHTITELHGTPSSYNKYRMIR